jgi:hypothetical protein
MVIGIFRVMGGEFVICGIKEQADPKNINKIKRFKILKDIFSPCFNRGQTTEARTLSCRQRERRTSRFL